MNFNNHVLVQFKLDSKKRTVALRQHDVIQLTSNKYIPGTKFWGSHGSKCGMYLDPQATHWALVDISNPDQPVFVLHDKFEDQPKVRKVYKIGNQYLVMRKLNKYFKYQISEFSSVKELREVANTKA